MPLGRLDDETTANAGRIEGGGATNVVPDSCLVELEARSIDHDRAAEVVTGDGRRRHRGGQRPGLRRGDHRGGAVPRLPSAPQLTAGGGGRAALESLGMEAKPVTTGGGSDANALIAAGLPMRNLANGTERNHRPDESVTVQALERMLDVTLAIVEEAGR